MTRIRLRVTHAAGAATAFTIRGQAVAAFRKAWQPIGELRIGEVRSGGLPPLLAAASRHQRLLDRQQGRCQQQASLREVSGSSDHSRENSAFSCRNNVYLAFSIDIPAAGKSVKLAGRPLVEESANTTSRQFASRWICGLRSVRQPHEGAATRHTPLPQESACGRVTCGVPGSLDG